MIAASVALLGAPLSLSAQSLDTDIRRLEQTWAIASRQNDTAAFGRLLAPDYTGMLVDGTTETREDRLRAFGSGTVRTLSLAQSDIRIRASGDLAIVTGLASRSETLRERRQDFQFRYTRVWQRRAGRWQVVLLQSTPVNTGPVYQPVSTGAISGVQRPDTLTAERSAGLIGAWRIASRTVTGPDSIYTNRRRDPGYYLFVAGYYALVAPDGEAPRSHDQTDVPRIAMHNVLGAHAGTYALRGDTLTLHSRAATIPVNLGRTIEWRALVRSDTLTLESNGTFDPDTRRRVRYVLTRAMADTLPRHATDDELPPPSRPPAAGTTP